MADDDAGRMLARMVERCDESARHARARGRRYYFVSYSLMILSVAGASPQA